MDIYRQVHNTYPNGPSAPTGERRVRVRVRVPCLQPQMVEKLRRNSGSTAAGSGLVVARSGASATRQSFAPKQIDLAFL